MLGKSMLFSLLKKIFLNHMFDDFGSEGIFLGLIGCNQMNGGDYVVLAVGI